MAVEPYTCVARKDFGDETYAEVWPMIFNHRIILCADLGGTWPEVLGGWCYPSRSAAIAALDAWDGKGDPDGWHKHVESGRTRVNGDPATERIGWA